MVVQRCPTQKSFQKKIIDCHDTEMLEQNIGRSKWTGLELSLGSRDPEARRVDVSVKLNQKLGQGTTTSRPDTPSFKCLLFAKPGG